MRFSKKNFFIFFLLFFFNCSGDKITKSKAAKMIKEAYNLPSEGEQTFSLTVELAPDQKSEIFERCANEGYLTYKSENIHKWDGDMSKHTAELTDKGRQFATGPVQYQPDGKASVTMKTSKVDFGEITNIKEDKENNTLEIQFTLIRKEINSFGKIALQMTEGTERLFIRYKKQDGAWKQYESGWGFLN